MKFSLFARTGITSAFGKKTDRVEAFRVEGEVLEAFDRAAARAGKPRVEFLRDLMAVVAFGRDHVVTVHRQRVDSMVQMLEGRPN